MVKNIDLPQKVKFKPRKKKTASQDSKALHRMGRTYEDFNTFLVENPDTLVVWIDTVHVKEIVDELYKVLGAAVFKRSFPVILTDNGWEF